MTPRASRLLWTTKAIAAAAAVSPKTVRRIVARFPSRFRPRALRRNGSHPRLHRVFDEQEAQFLFQVLAGFLPPA